MESTPFTARNVAKHVVSSVVMIKATNLARDTTVDYTRFEEDDMIVKIGSGVFGWGVASKVRPYTDRAVDKTADFIAKKRAERAAKKDTTTES